MNTLGERIKYLRNKEGLTQKELAAYLQVPRDTLANWEVDRAMPSVDMLAKLADRFKVTTDYLLGRETSVVTQHINDDEALEYLDELHKRPEMKTLFQVGRKATKEDIETAITIIEALKKKGGGEG